MSDVTKISVVVPIYNVEEYLEECLKSIEVQTFTSYEVLLVNDGSTDSSGEIAKQYVEQYPNWKLIQKVNGGLSSARNAGIAEAKGKYICFVDSDDYITKDYLQKLYEAVCEYQADMAIADYHEVDAAGKDLQKNKGKTHYEQGILKQEQVLDALTYVGDYHYATAVVVAWNKLIRTDIMKRFSYREGVLHEDEFLIMPLLLACKSVAWVKDDIYAYRQREGSIMQDAGQALRHLQILDAFEERIQLANTIQNDMLQRKLTMSYFWDIEVWYYFMRTKYKLPWYKLYGFFSKRMWNALWKYGKIWWMRKLVEYTIFAVAPEIYLKIIYK